MSEKNVQESIANRVKRIVAEQLGVDENEIKPKDDFINDLGADSLDLVDIVTECEKEFSINIPEEIMVTFDSLLGYIEEALN